MGKKLDLAKIEASRLSIGCCFHLAELILNSSRLPTQDPVFSLDLEMEDWERPDPNEPLPMWNIWGDAGLLTRPDIYSAYAKELGN